jgi:hypothetical protein
MSHWHPAILVFISFLHLQIQNVVFEDILKPFMVFLFFSFFADRTVSAPQLQKNDILIFKKMD